MAGRSFYYLIDNLNAGNASTIATALKAVAEVLEVKTHPSHGVVEVKALRDVEAQVKMACSIAGTTLRMRLDRRPF
jgi:hypothetical protein